jgi:hypothetical protein
MPLLCPETGRSRRTVLRKTERPALDYWTGQQAGEAGQEVLAWSQEFPGNEPNEDKQQQVEQKCPDKERC